MKRRHIYITITLLTIAAILLGAFKSNLPVVQYLGNATGVLLGFVLGIWWQETERERIRKEQEAEKKYLYQARVEQFWAEYKAFLLDFEISVYYLKQQTAQRDSIYDTIFEHRLPMPEAKYFERMAGELDLDKNTRQEIALIADKTQVIDEYIDMGTDKLKRWHSNYISHVDGLWVRVRELNVKHSKKTAI
jgi:hypothetical protein